LNGLLSTNLHLTLGIDSLTCTMKFISQTRNCPLCNADKKSPYLSEGELRLVKCNMCGFVFLDNLPDESEIYEDYFEQTIYSKDYTKFSKEKFLAEIYAINEQRLYYIRKLKIKGSILDIGCGTGLFLKTASNYGFDVTGIDVSNVAIKNAREQFGINADRKLISDLNPSDMQFDVITLWHVLEHLVNPLDDLKKIRTMLKPDGVLFIEVPNLNSAKFRLSGRKWQGGNHPLYHRSFFTGRNLREMLLRSGFKTVKRLNISYNVPGRNFLYTKSKELFNIFAMDSFLNYIAKN